MSTDQTTTDDRSAAGAAIGNHETDLDRLEDNLGYQFDDRQLLERALTHRSYANELDEFVRDNQRLEFLGDAVLGLVTAEELFRRDREVDEGALSSRQAQIVCEPALAPLATRLGLGDYLRLGKGEEQSGGRTKSSLLADAFEAVLAAIYLDGGVEPVREVIREAMGDVLQDVRSTPAPADYKSRLQAVVQRERAIQPVYEIIRETGPAHQREFVAEVRVDGEPMGTGQGRSKKQAEQRAAAQALAALEEDSDTTPSDR